MQYVYQQKSADILSLLIDRMSALYIGGYDILIVVCSLHQRECVQIYYCSRDCHKRRVEAVEHSTVSGQNIARVLNAYGALEERLYKVAPCSEEHNDNAHTNPLYYIERHFSIACVHVRILVHAYQGCHYYHQNTAAYASFPALARRHTWKQLVLAEERTAKIGTRVVGPEEYEHAQR